MDKHEQAQRFAEIFCDKIEKPFLVQTRERMEIIAENAWKLADAMQAEADKRKEKGFPEVIKFPELVAHGFDGWQPDWSQAPDGFNWFVVGSDGGYGFFTNIEPELFEDYYFVGSEGIVFKDHGFKGNWKDSLRKRPEGK